MIRRLAVLVTAAAVFVPAAPAHALGSPREPIRREPASVTISTTGNGHGKGLSQYGARNRANAGQSATQILEHYYPGTATGSAGGSIRVLLTGAPTRALVVVARSGLKARSLASGRTWTLPAKRDGRVVKKWRIKPRGDRSQISYRTGSWHEWKAPRGDAAFVSNQPAMLVGASTYRGLLRLTSSASSTWSASRPTCVGSSRARCGVLAPTRRSRPRPWRRAPTPCSSASTSRPVATTTCATPPPARSTRACRGAPRFDAAVRATAARILTYDGAPAFAQFSASNGGYSAAGDFPYLVAEWDEFDRGVPGDPQARTFTGEEITRHWTGLGDLVSVEVTGRDSDGVHDGHVTEVTITGTLRTQVTTGSAFARFLGLRSTMFTVS